MKHKYISALSLAVFGAASAYSQITLNPVAERSLGTPQLNVANSPQSPNLVAGREFFDPRAVALDNSVSPPILYVSDYVNNRVLAWQNANSFQTGQVADLAIGQPDLVTTFPAGPYWVNQKKSTYTSGLFNPSGLAVDQNGNLYVVDGGNNRVLRFPKQGSTGIAAAFAKTTQFPQPDLAIGQSGLNGFGANSPTNTPTPTAQGIFLNTGNSVYYSSLAFDSSGDLWVIDTGNIRVLRFNVSSLSCSPASGASCPVPAADVVLGQPSLTSNNSSLLNPGSAASFLNGSQFFEPTALAFDPNGNLFVGDYSPTCATLPCGRVLMFAGPNFSSAMAASTHILGVFPTGYTFPTGAAYQTLFDQTNVVLPTGLFFLPSGALGVVDGYFNQIMIFPPFASWPASGPPSITTPPIGQPSSTCTATASGTCKAANNGNPLPTSSTLWAPAGVACTKAQPGDVACTGNDLFLADAQNNRVLDLPLQGTTLGAATRVLGQANFTTDSPNLIEGREFTFTGADGSDAGMAVDASTGTPHLYVADPYNNRVLGFKDLRTFTNGGANQADIVLGQKDFTTALINYPSNSQNAPTSSSLYRPVGLLVDAQGNLYVADSLNGRVLRFPCPFAYAGIDTNSSCAAPGPAPEPADLVLGKTGFTSPALSDPSAANMYVPYGLAFTPSCNTLAPPCPAPNGLLVSDQLDNRVLYIPTTNGGFVAGSDNGKAATIVFGQTGFDLTGAGNSSAGLSNPHHVSCDTNGNVYVADTSNNRLLVFPNPASGSTAPFGQAAQAITGLNSPEGVYVSPITGEIWVANTGAGTYIRYAGEELAVLGQALGQPIADVSGAGCPNSVPCFEYAPLAVIQDQYGDLFGADNAHRVGLYFPGVSVTNSASFALATITRPLSPGAIATIFTVFTCNPCSPTQFLAPTTSFANYPLPKAIADTAVLVNGVVSPLYYVSGGQINFIVPSATPAVGSADVEVVQVSTGRVLGATEVPMGSYSPGSFGVQGTGTTFYAAAINQDQTVNSSTNPAIRGQFVSLYMTGAGVVPGAPADGVPPTAAISTPFTPNIQFGGPSLLPASSILYSGLNIFPGMWQINLTIPTTVVPVNGAVEFAVFTPDLQSNWNSGSGLVTYIYVK